MKYKITQSPEMNKRLSEEAYGTPEEAMEELIQNSIDGDATILWINVDQHKISIIDNGTGFNEERIKAFCTQGTDYKKLHSKSKSGRAHKGCKGIGRYAVFKLGKVSDIVTKTSDSGAKFWQMDMDEFVVGKELEIKEHVWDNGWPNTGTKITITNLQKSGKQLLSRLWNLRERVAMNWDLDECAIIINEAKVKPELVNYETKFHREYNRTYNDVFIKGTMGLMSKEAKVSGITIKVNKRGVGSPQYYGLEKNPRYGMFLSRIRGVLEIDSLNDAINMGRNGFNQTDPVFMAVSEFIKSELKEILDSKLKSDEARKDKSLNKALNSWFKEAQSMLKDVFDSFKSLWDDSDGDSGGKGGGRDLTGGKTRRGSSGRGGSGKKSKRLDGENDTGGVGRLKAGKYNWHIDRASLGTNAKFIVIDYGKLEATMNEDHPAFKMYTESKNFKFLTTELVYAIALETGELNPKELREAMDKILRKL